MSEKVVSKLLSGKFILTVVCAFVFAYAVYKKLIPNEATIVILTGVFKDYFNKDKNGA